MTQKLPTERDKPRFAQLYIYDTTDEVIEKELMNFFQHNNQKKLRTDLYNNVCDAVSQGDADSEKLGKKIILPSSFTGGPRYMVEKYQDAMVICRWYENPKWEEVNDYQLGQKENTIQGNTKLPNRYDVQHNLQLLKKNKPHIDVEWCNRSSAIKHLFKYITKGEGMATMKIENKQTSDHNTRNKSKEEIYEIKNNLGNHIPSGDGK